MKPAIMMVVGRNQVMEKKRVATMGIAMEVAIKAIAKKKTVTCVVVLRERITTSKLTKTTVISNPLLLIRKRIRKMIRKIVFVVRSHLPKRRGRKQERIGAS